MVPERNRSDSGQRPGGVYADERLLEKSADYIPSVPMLFVEDGDIESEYKQEIPAGSYICMYYHDGGLEEYSPLL